MIRRPPRSTLFPYTRSSDLQLGSTLQSCPNTLEQNLIVEWFCHELHCACSQGLHPHFLVPMCRDEDGRNPILVFVELGLQFQTRHSRHTDVRDQTSNLVLLAGLKEFLR